MAEYLTTDTDLQSVADAIRAKSGTSEPLEYPDGFVSAIEDIPTGGGGGSSAVPKNQVNFYDYDGTCVYSYTPSEFAALTEMPANPSHEGLTAQGWNWSLSDAKTYVTDYGRLDVGQMYITDDGKTRIYIHLEQGRTSPMLGCCPDGTVDVDWGDGTAHDTLTGTSITTVKWTPTHNYAAPGDYVIKLTVNGSMGFYGNASTNQYSGILRYTSNSDARNNAYRNAIYAVEIGNGITKIDTYAFDYCFSLSSITIPDSVTNINSNAFDYCYSLSSITIPDSVMNIGSNAFRYCYSLSSIIIPDSVASIDNYAFDYCYSLSSITIPDSVMNIGSDAFRYCYTLSSIIIPDSITSINGSVFANCYTLSSIIIPDSVTSIGKSGFGNCHSLGELHFKPATPPSVLNSNTLSTLPADCKIYVPTGSLEAYTSATNYPSSTIYTYIEE